MRPRHPAAQEIDDLVAAMDRDPALLGDVLTHLSTLRNRSRELGAELDRRLLERLHAQRRTLLRLEGAQRELRALVEEICAPPWHPARMLRRVEPAAEGRALVQAANGPRVVKLAPGLEADALRPGDAVFLNDALALIVARDGEPPRGLGDTVLFERLAADGRLTVRWRDEEWLVDAAATLEPEALRPGDRLLVDRAARLALERIQPAETGGFRVEQVPDLPLEAVGGGGDSLRRLHEVLTGRLLAPERAGRYGLAGRRSILLHGPPGCGKTLRARVAAAQIRRASGRPCHFAVVRPGEFESPWVGETEARIRECFAALRRAAGDGAPAILFLDEVEAVARVRGGPAAHLSDKFLAALLAEIDGFAERGDVALIAATNRKDLLDPAFLSRICDVEIAIGRPDRREARGIFEVHLGRELPYAPDATRGELVEAALTRLYSPNGDSGLGTLHLRDGRTRPVRARDLMSGRVIQQICLHARERAFASHDERGDTAGLRVEDVLDGVDDAIERLRSTLTVRNVRAHLDDLPDDVDVVRVERDSSRLRRAHRYVEAA